MQPEHLVDVPLPGAVADALPDAFASWHFGQATGSVCGVHQPIPATLPSSSSTTFITEFHHPHADTKQSPEQEKQQQVLSPKKPDKSTMRSGNTTTSTTAIDQMYSWNSEWQRASDPTLSSSEQRDESGGATTTITAAERVARANAVASRFEEHVARTVYTILTDASSSSSASKKRTIQPIAGGPPNRFLHDGVYYCFFNEDSHRNYYGSVENAHKALSAELRGIRYLWRQQPELNLCTPLCTIVSFCGLRVFAAALIPIAEDCQLTGPVNAKTIRVLADLHRQSGLAHRVAAAFNVSCTALPAPAHVKEYHIAGAACVVGALDMCVYFSPGAKQLYAINAGRLMPPLAPAHTVTLPTVVGQQQKPRQQQSQPQNPTSPTTAMVPRRSVHQQAVARVANDPPSSSGCPGRNPSCGGICAAPMKPWISPPRQDPLLRVTAESHTNRFGTIGTQILQRRLMLPAAVRSTCGEYPLSNLAFFEQLSTKAADSDVVRVTEWITTACVDEVAARLARASSHNSNDDDAATVSAAQLKKIMQESGVNVGWLGALYRAVKAARIAVVGRGARETAASATVAVDASKVTRHRALTRVTQGDSSSVAFKRQATMKLSAPALQQQQQQHHQQQHHLTVVGPSLHSSRDPSCVFPLVSSPRTPKSPPQAVEFASEAHRQSILSTIKLEIVARAFRVIFNERLRAAYTLGMKHTAEPSAASPVLKPQSKRQMVIESSRSVAAISFDPSPPPANGTSKKRATSFDKPGERHHQSDVVAASLSPASTAEKLLHTLKSMDALSPRTVQRALQLETSRSLARYAALHKPALYCRDAEIPTVPTPRGAATATTSTTTTTVLEQINAEVVLLLNLLVGDSPGAHHFWCSVLQVEVWTKYRDICRPDELRSGIDLSALLSRVCELCGIELAHGLDKGLAFETKRLADPFATNSVLALHPVVKGITHSTCPTSYSVQVSRIDAPFRSNAVALDADIADAEAALLQQLRDLGEYRCSSPSSTICSTRKADDVATVDTANAATRAAMRDIYSDLVTLYRCWGAAKASDLALARFKLDWLSVQQTQDDLLKMWTRSGLDGICYTSCPGCHFTINPTQRSRMHDCELARQLKDVVDRGCHTAGLSDGRLPDSCLSCSSNGPGSKVAFARLGLCSPVAWSPSSPAPEKEWIQVTLPAPAMITGVETEGSPDGGYVKYYRVCFSEDGRTWYQYCGEFLHRDTALVHVAPQRMKVDDLSVFASTISAETAGPKTPQQGQNREGSGASVKAEREYVLRGVMLGNSEHTCIAHNDFVTPFEAQFVRLVIGCDVPVKAKPALRLELLCRERHPAVQATNTVGGWIVPMCYTDWGSMLPGARKSRHQAATEELAISSKVADAKAAWSALTANLAASSTTKLAAAESAAKAVKKCGSDLIDAHSQWISLLREWGQERVGDLSRVHSMKIEVSKMVQDFLRSKFDAVGNQQRKENAKQQQQRIIIAAS